jgi:branched-subunit amino acid aminotransferase/4-amino-4-deoxychorismate lyase
MAATRHAQGRGYDDALLISTDGVVLEGPTYSVAWVIAGVVETPSLSLGILDSITRRVVIELAGSLGIGLVETTATLTRLDVVDEVFLVSTIREVQPVTAVGDRGFQEGPVTEVIGQAFRSSI